MRVCAIIQGTVLALTVLPAAPPAAAQGTLEDYRRAANVRQRLDDLTVGVAGAPTWIDGTSSFWYRLSVTGGNEFVLVDAETQQKTPAFDHAALAEGLSAATGREYGALTLPFRSFEYVRDGEAIEVGAAGDEWRCSLADFACEAVEESGGRGPQRRWRRLRELPGRPQQRSATRLARRPDRGVHPQLQRCDPACGWRSGRRPIPHHALLRRLRRRLLPASINPVVPPTRRSWSPTASGRGTTGPSTSCCRPPRTSCSRSWTRCSTASPATCSTSTGPSSSMSRARRASRSTTRSSRTRTGSRRWSGGRTGAPSPSSTTSAGTRSTASSRWTPRPATLGPSSRKRCPPSSTTAGCAPTRATPGSSSARTSTTGGRSSGCRNGTVGTTSTCTTASPAR